MGSERNERFNLPEVHHEEMKGKGEALEGGDKQEPRAPGGSQVLPLVYATQLGQGGVSGTKGSVTLKVVQKLWKVHITATTSLSSIVHLETAGELTCRRNHLSPKVPFPSYKSPGTPTMWARFHFCGETVLLLIREQLYFWRCLTAFFCFHSTSI